jgi:hypothetical protein
VFVVLDDGIQGRRVDEAFFDQQGFERFDPQRKIAGNRAVIVIMFMAVEIVGTYQDILLEPFGFFRACSQAATPSKRDPEPLV